MSKSFQPFEISIESHQSGEYEVRASFIGVERRAILPATLPLLQEREIEQAIAWLERGFIDRDYARDFGWRLFQTLFPEPIRQLFREALQRVEPNDGLQLLLNFPLPPDLARLPWELLYDQEGGLGFLARSSTAPLARHHTDLPLPFEPPTSGPLRVLVVTASPPGKPAVSSQAELAQIRRSLDAAVYSPVETLQAALYQLQTTRSLRGFSQRLRQRRLVEIDVLADASKADIQNRLIQKRQEGQAYHIIHFAGHAESDETGSRVLLQDGALPAESFAELLAEPTINLVVLNACETASLGIFNSLSEALLRKRIPAVIGMQVPVLDRAAVEFAREFYGAWAAGEPIESALAYARRLVSQQASGQASDWSIPVLFIGPSQGLTLQITPPALRIPWQLKAVRWGVASIFTLIASVALLLQVPDIARSVRMEIPIVRCVYPYPMKADPSLNIVVSNLSVQDERGRIITTEDGLKLSRRLYDQLNASLESLDLPFEYDIRSPDDLCPIKADTAQGRSDAAKKLAEDIRADIVIYGLLVEKENRGSYTPEFYVSYEGFNQVPELTGEYQLGSPLRLDLPIQEADLIFNKYPPLTGRTDALVYVSLGLSAMALDNYDLALQHFMEADAVPGWTATSGKQVLYFLIGNTYERKAGQIRKITPEEYRQYLDDAQRYYQQAVTPDSSYARGQLGLANLIYLNALGDLFGPVFQVDLDRLAEAEQAYRAVLDLDAPSQRPYPDTGKRAAGTPVPGTRRSGFKTRCRRGRKRCSKA